MVRADAWMNAWQVKGSAAVDARGDAWQDGREGAGGMSGQKSVVAMRAGLTAVVGECVACVAAIEKGNCAHGMVDAAGPCMKLSIRGLMVIECLKNRRGQFTVARLHEVRRVDVVCNLLNLVLHCIVHRECCRIMSSGMIRRRDGTILRAER